MRDRRSLTLVEFLVSICVVAIFLGIFAAYANIALRVAREDALRHELVNIRMSLKNYHMIKGKLPESLFSLMNQKIEFQDENNIFFNRGFLKPFRIDEEGNLIDPFLNRYYYDWEKGIVRSQTKGYQSW